LGLAHRVDFELEESAAAYAKAIELQPDSLTARRGLAEMDRSLGKPDEAIGLYREILAKDEANLPAQTGLILAMFDAGQREQAEAEMAKSLEANPGNDMLLAGAAYGYAAHNDGEKAIAFAQKAIDSDPRFIWSHIALARGLIAQKKAVAAERVLLAARRYGNFPTLEYEIASARLAAGLYRDAAEELSKSFSVKDGMIHADLGGRVARESKLFTELVGFERRASIFAPTAADDPETAAQLSALLRLRQALDASQPDAAEATSAVDDFVRGDDAMKVHRQLYAASSLLEKNLALPKALELAKAAPQSLDAGLKVPDPVTPVIAGELYESRRIALTRGEFITTPIVREITVWAILGGRVEDLTGWAIYA
jgi:tetratricopeptide (TPR) repeat protein